MTLPLPHTLRVTFELTLYIVEVEVQVAGGPITAAAIGGKYLVFVSSRSVKMRGFSFLSLHAF